MKITERDKEILRWLLEQKIMSERQVRNVFWKDLIRDNREAYRRLSKLKKAGCLKTNKTGIYQYDLYLLTRKGIKEISEFNPLGLGETSDTGFSSLHRDLVVTDLRIMLYLSGYTHWTSKRILSKEDKLQRIPDGIIHHKDKVVAFEYGSCHKTKREYRKMAIDYSVGLSHEIDWTVYITDTMEFAYKLARDTYIYDKVYFVSLNEIQQNQMKAHLFMADGDSTLHEILETSLINS